MKNQATRKAGNKKKIKETQAVFSHICLLVVWLDDR